MAKAFEQILGYQALTGVINNPAAGVPNDILDPEWLSTTTPIDGDVSGWYNIGATQKAATTVQRGSPSRRVQYQAQGFVSAKCISSFEHVMHPMAVVGQLKNYTDQNAQGNGEKTIDAQSIEFKRRFTNLRLSAIYSMLSPNTSNKIYFDGNGEILGTSSGAVTTVDFQVPSAQKGAITTALGGVVWSNAAADIPAQIAALQLAAAKNGVRINTCYYGSAIRGYLLSNTMVKSIMTSDSGLASSLRNNKIPSGMFDIDNWKPCYRAFTDLAGTKTAWFPSDALVFTTVPDRSWYEVQEGSFPMPTKDTIGATPEEIAKSFMMMNGMGGYAEMATDAPGIKQYGFDTFLPALKNPNYIWSLNANS